MKESFDKELDDLKAALNASEASKGEVQVGWLPGSFLSKFGWVMVGLLLSKSFCGSCRLNWRRQMPLFSHLRGSCNSRRSRRTGSKIVSKNKGALHKENGAAKADLLRVMSGGCRFPYQA